MRLFTHRALTTKRFELLLTALLTVGVNGGPGALRADDAQPVVHYRPETPDDSAPAKVVSATIVKSPESQAPDEGNVQVTYANGQSAVLTTDGRDSKPKVSPGGIVGWVTAIGHDPKYGCVKTVLNLRMADGTLKRFECNALFIEAWGLDAGDSQLVIKSMQHHGPYFYIQYDLKSGQVLAQLDHYVAYADLPKWAQPYADPND